MNSLILQKIIMTFLFLLIVTNLPIKSALIKSQVSSGMPKLVDELIMNIKEANG